MRYAPKIDHECDECHKVKRLLMPFRIVCCDYDMISWQCFDCRMTWDNRETMKNFTHRESVTTLACC